MIDLENPGIVPVIRLKKAADTPRLLQALYDGGIRAAEFTMTTPGALEALKSNKAAFAGRLYLGMGTVTSAAMAADAIAAGADFLVSPFPVLDALAVAKEHGVPFIMGAFTPGEVFTVWQAGADYVKVFPINVLGLNYLKDLRGPLPQVKFFPTGGIGLEHIGDLFRLGVKGCGVGGSLVKTDMVEREDWAGLTALAARFLAAKREAGF